MKYLPRSLNNKMDPNEIKMGRNFNFFFNSGFSHCPLSKEPKQLQRNISILTGGTETLSKPGKGAKTKYLKQLL
jgi:hypothetical protein